MQTATRPEEAPRAPAPALQDPCDPASADETAPEPRRTRFDPRGRRGTQRPLPLRTRIILGTVGGLLVVLGIAGLFLPFLQGILFLVLAAAILSLTSRRVYHWLQSVVGDRWPHAWQRVERFRTRVRWKLRKK